MVHMWRWFSSSNYFVPLLWPCSCSYDSQKSLIRVLVWIPNLWCYNMTQPLNRMTHEYKLCELCAFVVLEPHQVLVWITDRSPRYNNNTNTRQNKTLFRIKVRFSDALLVSQKNTKTNNTFTYYKLCPRSNNNTSYIRQNKTLFQNESKIFWIFSCIT